MLRDRTAALVHASLRFPLAAARSGKGGQKTTSSSAIKQGTSQTLPTPMPNTVEASTFLAASLLLARSGKGGHKRTSSSTTKQGTSHWGVPTPMPNSVEASTFLTAFLPSAGRYEASSRGGNGATWQKIDLLGVSRIAAGGGYASLDVFTAAVKASATAVLAAATAAAAFGDQRDLAR